MNALFLTVSLLLNTPSWAQVVVPIFDNNGMRTGITMPFKFNPQGSGGRLISVSVSTLTGGSECAVALDPLVSNNLLVKCQSTAQMTLDIVYATANEVRGLKYGPIAIRDLKPGYQEPNPLFIPGSDPRGYRGGDIIRGNCKGCHTVPGNLRNKSEIRIGQALSGAVPLMPARPGYSAADITAIRLFLENIEGYGGW